MVIIVWSILRMYVCMYNGTASYLGAIGGRGSAETSNTVLTAVGCLGNESSIADCSIMETVDCTSQEIATSICQGDLLLYCTAEVSITGMIPLM